MEPWMVVVGVSRERGMRPVVLRGGGGVEEGVVVVVAVGWSSMLDAY
jgi:hypothetical protein